MWRKGGKRVEKRVEDGGRFSTVKEEPVEGPV
jgi:hypothetical protein